MTIYPEQTWVSWLDDLFAIGNINISVKIEPSINGNVINQLTKKLVQAQSEYATYSRQGNILHLPELEKQIGDLEDLRMLIQTNQDKLFYATIFISLNAESLKDLNEKTVPPSLYVILNIYFRLVFLKPLRLRLAVQVQ